jgi:hypothetical protein
VTDQRRQTVPASIILSAMLRLSLGAAEKRAFRSPEEPYEARLHPLNSRSRPVCIRCGRSVALIDPFDGG